MTLGESLIKHVKFVLLVAIVASLAGCGTPFSLVNPGVVPVAKKGYSVQPQSSWNRIPKAPGDIPQEESWTKNGVLLDSVAFVGGLPAGKALVKQHKKADEQVPVFRADMSPDDLVSMIESSYRIGGVTAFEVAGVEPVQFLGAPAVRFDFNYVPPDKLPRKGRCVMAVSSERLYLMKLEGASSHYFDAALPEFESMLASATLR